MNRITELRKKRSKLWLDAIRFLDEHRGSDGCLSDEDEAVYEKMEADVVRLGKEIERLEIQAHITKEAIQDMNDYCARESTLTDDYPCEREMSVGEIVREVRKELAETLSCLSIIKVSLDGEAMTDRKNEEPKCLRDELKQIERMATDCIGLSHTIHDRLFFSPEGRI